MHTASGTFEIDLTPDPESVIGRMLISKTLSGDLVGTSAGEMLSFRSKVEGSAGYVAMETIRGSLSGKNGSFVVMHTGEMNRGESSLIVKVVPDSGTDEWEGIHGEMTIDNKDGQHHYTLTYDFT